MDTAIVTTCDNTINANLIKTKLESEGIPCYLFNEYSTNLLPHFFNLLGSGVQVVVHKNDLERAKAIAEIPEGKLVCPNCGSDNFTMKIAKPLNKISTMIFSFFFGIPIGNLLNHYKCRNCNSEFRG